MNLRRLGRSAFIYGLQPVLARTASFLMLPVYTRYLSTGDYGILQLLGTTVEIISILFTAGAINGVNRFYFKTEDEAERRRLLSTAWQLHCLLALGGGALLLLVAPLVHSYLLKGEGTVLLVRIAAINLATSVLATIPQLRLQLTERASLYTGSNFARLLAQLSMNIAFVAWLDLGVLGPLLSTLITNILFGGTLAIVMLRDTGWQWDQELKERLVAFGRPSRYTAIGSFLLNFGDRYFLAAFWSTAVVGLYGLAYQFGFGFGQFFVTPLSRAWDPIRYSMGNRARQEWEPEYLRIFELSSAFYLAGFAATGAFIQPVLRILTAPAYFPAASLVPAIVSAYLFQAWTASFVYQLNMAERPGLYAQATGVAIAVVLVLYAVLIPPYGAHGAAWATLIAFATRCVVAYRAAQTVWPIAYNWSRTRIMAAMAVTVNLAAFSARDRSFVMQAIVGTTSFACFLLVSVRWVLPSAERRALLDLFLRRSNRAPSPT